MKIEVYEHHDGSKLVAYLLEDDGKERELVRSEIGNDDLLNKIDDMNLSFVTVTFHWASTKLEIDVSTVKGFNEMPVWAQEIFSKTHEKHMQAMGAEMRARHSKIDRVEWVPAEQCVHVYFEHDWYHYDDKYTWY